MILQGRWTIAAAAAAAFFLSGCAEQPGSTGGEPPAARTDRTGQTGQTPAQAATPRSSGRPGDMQPSDFAPEYRSGVVLVFYAKPGCKACEQEEPIFEEAIKRLPTGAKSTKIYPYMVDLDAYNVTDLPTLIVYRDGREQKRFVGVTAGQKLLSAVNSAM